MIEHKQTGKARGSRIRALTFSSLLLVAGLGTSSSLMAGEFFDEGGAAIRGYDAVAYFTDNKPVQGKPEFSTKYKGATFQFASAAHRDTFAANPEKYAPQFGGFCSYAAALGKKASVDPAAFSVVNNKLYLNYSKQVQVKWNEDVPGYIQKANNNWPTVSKTEY